MAAQSMSRDPASHQRKVQQTLHHLDQTFHDTSLASQTGLGIPEIQALKQEIAEIFPASNLPAFLLQGLLQLQDRALQHERVAADLTVLFRGSTQIGLYSTLLAAPAMVLYGYQRLLTLAGKDVASAFPDGPWQFYTEFGLREDAARHTVETIGWRRAVPDAAAVDAATCWVAAAIQTIIGYDDLLENEWHERVLLRALDAALADEAARRMGRRLPRKIEERERAIAEQVEQLRQTYRVQRLETTWAARRPYSAPPAAAPGDYAAYRRRCFDQFAAEALGALPAEVRAAMEQHYATRRARDLPAFLEQMTLLKMLQPDAYREYRAPLPLETAAVGLAVNGRYLLIPVIDRDSQGDLLVFPPDAAPGSAGIGLKLTRAPDGAWYDRYNHPVQIDRRGRVRVGGRLIGRLRPPPLDRLKGLVRAAFAASRAAETEAATLDLLLAQTPRSRQNALRARLPKALRAELEQLRRAPIIITWERRDGGLPLSALRRTHRGCGDHALTLIATDRSMVFDLSHIFFDGIWGMAMAEIVTGFATALYPAVAALKVPPAPPATPLTLAAPPALHAAHAVTDPDLVEVAAETNAINLTALNRLRQRMAERKLELTVNDILLLARCAHAAAYRPGAHAQPALAAIADLDDGPQLVRQFEHYCAEQRSINPAILIPMDASAVDPRLRLYPATFRNPLTDLLPRLQRCNALLEQLVRQPEAALRREFEEERKLLSADLLKFGLLLRTLRQVTMRGESFSTAALRLMGHLPAAMQNLVDLIPQKFDVLNEIVKGREVFSNVGQVATTASLTRFASSRDDGETKALVWGVMSNATGQLYVTLRDFRPHVGPLVQRGRADLAQALTEDFVAAYADSVNGLVRRIQRVLAHKQG